MAAGNTYTPIATTTLSSSQNDITFSSIPSTYTDLVIVFNGKSTNAGTSSAANLSISAGTTSAIGALQLTDSVSSTSTTTAAI